MSDSNYSSLLYWFKSFPEFNSICKIEDLFDGHYIACCANLVDPIYFTNEWLTTYSKSLKTDSNSLTNIKHLNFLQLFISILTYTNGILERPVRSIDLFEYNIQKISSLTWFLLQELLFIAINSKEKAKYVERIMKFDNLIQQDLMEIIQNLNSGTNMSTSYHHSFNMDPEIYSVNALKSEKDKLIQTLSDKNTSIKELKYEYELLHSEFESMQESKATLQEEGQRCKELLVLNAELDNDLQLKNSENVILKTELDELSIKCEYLEEELITYQNNDLENLNKLSEIEKMRDQLDEMHHMELKLAQNEKIIKKLEFDSKNILTLKDSLVFNQEINTKLIQEKVNLEKKIKDLEFINDQAIDNDELLAKISNELSLCKKKLMEKEMEASSFQNQVIDLQHKYDLVLLEYSRMIDSSKIINACSAIDNDVLICTHYKDNSFEQQLTSDTIEKVHSFENENVDLNNRILNNQLLFQNNDNTFNYTPNTTTDTPITTTNNNNNYSNNEKFLFDNTYNISKSNNNNSQKHQDNDGKHYVKADYHSHTNSKSLNHLSNESNVFLSTWYKMAMEIQKNYSRERMTHYDNYYSGTSFLHYLRKNNDKLFYSLSYTPPKYFEPSFIQHLHCVSPEQY